MTWQPSMDVLVGAIKQSDGLCGLTLEQWDWLIRVGRRADVLARIGLAAYALKDGDCVPPEPVRMHLRSAMALAQRQRTELHYEVQAIIRALRIKGIEPILLKGAAYVLSDRLAGQGRLVSDVDILVPRERLNEAEVALMLGGWISSDRDPYNQSYYRRWMHELPPMTHMQRGTTVDIHHALVPPTAGYGVNSQTLLEAAHQDASGFRILCDTDQVIHSAVHLMHEGELEMGFRGLLDLDSLMSEFSQNDPGFWKRLADRSIELGLQRPVFLALRYTQKCLGLFVPKSCLSVLKAHSGRLGFVRLAILDALYLRGLRPHHATLDDRFSGVARWLLFVRSHMLRMPLRLLLPHLARKSFKRLGESLRIRGKADAKA